VTYAIRKDAFEKYTYSNETYLATVIFRVKWGYIAVFRSTNHLSKWQTSSLWSHRARSPQFHE